MAYEKLNIKFKNGISLKMYSDGDSGEHYENFLQGEVVPIALVNDHVHTIDAMFEDGSVSFDIPKDCFEQIG